MKIRTVLSSVALATAALLGGNAFAADLPSVVLVHGAFADGSDWPR
jgi:hypothetical protein